MNLEVVRSNQTIHEADFTKAGGFIISGFGFTFNKRGDKCRFTPYQFQGKNLVGMATNPPQSVMRQVYEFAETLKPEPEKPTENLTPLPVRIGTPAYLSDGSEAMISLELAELTGHSPPCVNRHCYC